MRFIHIEVPDLEHQQTINLDNFEEMYPTLKLPYKLQHPEHVKRSKDFVRLRLEKYPNGLNQIQLSDYVEIYQDVVDKQEQEKVRNDIEIVLMYYNRILSKSVFCPESIPLADMRKIIYDYHTYSSRIRYIHFLFVREFDNWRKEIDMNQQKEKRRKLEEAELASFNDIGCFDNEGNLQYGYWRNTLFTRYFEKCKMKYSLNRLRQAQMFGQKIVIDCSFDETMADYEMISVARQISSIYHHNRFHNDPFKVLFCGYRETNRGYQHAVRLMSDVINNPGYFFNLHKESYKELLPGERLIYLSPDARKLMDEFDPNAVYIIGALVSKTHKSYFTYEKARNEGIECLRLPIHNYVQLKPGVKRVLSFQGVFKILLELKHSGNWEKALRAGIPSHKLVNDNDNLHQSI